MLTYPKLETLYDRQEDFSVDVTKIRVPAWTNVRNWIVTEKIDGMNVRIGLHMDGSVEFNGRTDNAQLPSTLVSYLRKTFTEEKMQTAFIKEGETCPEVVVFGEGYGPGIQKGGTYRKDVAVRIFDVNVGGWWLEWEDVMNVAWKLGVLTVPMLGVLIGFPESASDLALNLICNANPNSDSSSPTAIEDSGQIREAEGIVARADPMLLTRRGDRCAWKLKFSDFRAGKK